VTEAEPLSGPEEDGEVAEEEAEAEQVMD